VIKAPVTSEVYDVPAIQPGESVHQYLNDALYIAPNMPRHGTVGNLPKGTYTLDLLLFSNCTLADRLSAEIRPDVACDDSIMLALSTLPPLVTDIGPVRRVDGHCRLSPQVPCRIAALQA
jgi:hypothetical protein